MKSLLFLLSLISIKVATAQYRFDNVDFKNVHWNELCDMLRKNPQHLLLDVRSKGEHHDTSQSKNLNIGRLMGAVNIDIREIDKRLNEIEDFKSKPVFVYCSHSQRSRRVSKMLADSGFTKVYNINGGLSNLHMFNWPEDCNLLKNSLPYQLVSPRRLASLKEKYHLVDLRSDSSFHGISMVERKNAHGRFKNARHVPFKNLKEQYHRLPGNEKILLVDENGMESVLAAEFLSEQGFKDVSILFNGLEGYITEVAPKDRKNWINNVKYTSLNAVEFNKLASKNPPFILDIRNDDEFQNQSKDDFRNTGHLKNAVNIPFSTWPDKLTRLPSDRNAPIVIYNLSTTNEIFEVAKKLSDQGYKNVHVLMGGLFNLRWRAANIKGLDKLNHWVVNLPAESK